MFENITLFSMVGVYQKSGSLSSKAHVCTFLNFEKAQLLSKLDLESLTFVNIPVFHNHSWFMDGLTRTHSMVDFQRYEKLTATEFCVSGNMSIVSQQGDTFRQTPTTTSRVFLKVFLPKCVTRLRYNWHISNVFKTLVYDI